MKVYLINLDRSAERLAHMDAQLRRAGIAYQRVAAVDGRTLSPADCDSASLSGAEIGCALSHRKVWDLIVRGGEPYAIILEDDIHLAGRFANLFLDSTWIPRDADLVKLETMLRKVNVDRQAQSTAHGHRLVRLRSGHLGMAGYIISSGMAQMLCAAAFDTDTAVDDLLFGLDNRLKPNPIIYQVDPALCAQDHVLAARAGKKLTFVSTITRLPKRLRWASKVRREIIRIANQAAPVVKVQVGLLPPFERRVISLND